MRIFFARQDAKRAHIRRYLTDEQHSIAEKRPFSLLLFKLIDYKRDFDVFQGEGRRNSRAIAPDDNAERRKISLRDAIYILCQHL